MYVCIYMYIKQRLKYCYITTLNLFVVLDLDLKLFVAKTCVSYNKSWVRDLGKKID